MDSSTIEAMHEQVRVIYRVTTGQQLDDEFAPLQGVAAQPSQPGQTVIEQSGSGETTQPAQSTQPNNAPNTPNVPNTPNAPNAPNAATVPTMNGASCDEAEIERRFSMLDTLVRADPAWKDRIPPFSFTPLVDVLEGSNEFLIEIAVPGVDGADVSVDVAQSGSNNEVVVRGVRRGACGSNGRTFLRAAIPRGPFHTVITLPCAIGVPSNVSVERGVIAIELPKLR